MYKIMKTLFIDEENLFFICFRTSFVRNWVMKEHFFFFFFINVEIILYILNPWPSHDLSTEWIVADRDLSRYRIMASYVLT